MLAYLARMRLSALVALALAATACSSKPRYQGDVVFGSYNFDARPVEDTCNVTGDAGFTFTGVLSYDTQKAKLYLDTDGDWQDDHAGTLSGIHYVLEGHGKRDLGCGTPIPIDEVLEGDLFPSAPAGGCDAGWGDGGSGVDIDAGDIHQFVPTASCGELRDDASGLDGGGSGCGVCRIRYQLVGTRAQ